MLGRDVEAGIAAAVVEGPAGERMGHRRQRDIRLPGKGGTQRRRPLRGQVGHKRRRKGEGRGLSLLGGICLPVRLLPLRSVLWAHQAAFNADAAVVFEVKEEIGENRIDWHRLWRVCWFNPSVDTWEQGRHPNAVDLLALPAPVWMVLILV